MKRKRLSLLFCFSLCLSLTAPVLAAEGPVFSDVPAGSWFEEGVATCVQEGVMVGTGGGHFSPDSELTVAECLALALRLYDLQRGGNGSLEKAPEDWGRMTLTLNDGTVFQGYGEVYQPFAWSDGEDGGLYVSCEDYGSTLEEEEDWGYAHLGPATVSLSGREIPGTIRMRMGLDNYLLFFAPENVEDNEIIKNAYYEEAPNSQKWYRDAAYTTKAWGLRNDLHPGFSGLLEWSGSDLDHPATRQEFALALHDAAGNLEKKASVDTIPDLGYYGGLHFLTREKDEGIFALYEAGILTGIDEFGTFGSEKMLTRAEAATMVARVLDPHQRLTVTSHSPNAYEQAIINMRSGFTYYQASERIYETEDCSIFVYDRGGAMHTGPGNITIIYKPGSQPGAGTVLGAETPNTWATLQTGVDMLRLSEDRKTFTYGYLIENELFDLAMEVSGPAGFYTYTVDLPTGTTTSDYAPLSYESSLLTLSYGRNYTLEKHLEGGACTLLLRWKPLHPKYPDIKDYELWLVRKDDTGSHTRLLLPSTAYTEDCFAPTDRAPDSLEISEDGRTLTYLYRFDEALEDYHDAGTYTYTVDLTTGELTVEHAPL